MPYVQDYRSRHGSDVWAPSAPWAGRYRRTHDGLGGSGYIRTRLLRGSYGGRSDAVAEWRSSMISIS